MTPVQVPHFPSPPHDDPAQLVRLAARRHERPWLRAATILTTSIGTSVIFGFGFFIGRFAEPVNGMPAGIAWTVWIALAPIVATVIISAISVHRAGRSRTHTARIVQLPAAGANQTSALDLFPPERRDRESSVPSGRIRSG